MAIFKYVFLRDGVKMDEGCAKINSVSELEAALSEKNIRVIEVGKDISRKIRDEITHNLNYGRLTGRCPYHEKPLQPTGCIVDGSRYSEPKMLIRCPVCMYTSEVNLTVEEMSAYDKRQRELVF